MTVPLIPARHGAASPTPRAFDPESVSDWINVLHHANAVKPDAPDYAEARQVAAQAWARIGHLQRKAGAQDREDQNFKPVAADETAVPVFANRLLLGTPELIAGGIDAGKGFLHRMGAPVSDGSFREGARRYREGLEQIEMSNPRTAYWAERAADVASIGLGAAAASPKIVAGVPLSTTDKVLRIAKGAGTGAGIAGVGGFAEGGEDPGDWGQRVDAGLRSAKIGGLLGGVFTGIGLRYGRKQAEADANLVEAANRRARGAEKLEQAKIRTQQMREGSIRTQKPGYATLDPPTQDLPEHVPTTRGGPYDASADLPGRPAKPIDWTGVSEDMRLPPDAPPPAAPATVPPRPPTPNPSSSTPEPVYPAPQRPPSPPKAPEGWGEPTEAMLRTRRDVVRQGADPTKSYQELYGDVIPPPQSQPNPILAEAMQAPRAAEGTLRPARKVPAGPYQKAAPATRMQSASPLRPVDQALMVADQHPELLEYVPTKDLENSLAAEAFTLGPDADPALAAARSARLDAVRAELAKRDAAAAPKLLRRRDR